MYYSEEIIEEVLSRNDLVDVVSEYIRLKKQGSSYFGLCPFHNEDTPSFSVSPDKQMYYCFGCQAGGNVFTFIMQMENYSFAETVKYLADRANITLPQPEYSAEVKKALKEKEILRNIHKEAAKYFYYNLQSERGKVALEYLQGRKVEEKIRKLFGLGYANADYDDLYKYLLYKRYDEEFIAKSGLVIPRKTGKGYIDRFRNRVMFPIFDVHNNIIGFGGRVLDDSLPKYMNSPETQLFDKSRNLYGLNYARTARENNILIVEGYMDVISLYQAGFKNVVASLGTAFTYQHAALLKRYTNEVVLVYDNDAAGIKAALRAIPILSSAGLKIKVLQIPGEKDPDDFIKEKGPEAFRDLIMKALSSVMFQVNVVKAKYNLENLEEKIQFTKEVANILAKLNSSIEIEVYSEQIAEETGVSKQSILEEIKKLRAIRQKENRKINKSSFSTNESENNLKSSSQQKADEKDGLYKAQLNLLRLISQNETIYQKIKDYLSFSEFIDPVLSKAAKLIYESYGEGRSIEAAKIINHFENLQEQNQVATIFNEEKSSVKEYDVEKAINDQIKLIKRANIDLKSRATTDIYEIQALIEQKKQLEKLYINIISG